MLSALATSEGIFIGGIMSQWVRDKNENGVEWKRPASEVVDLEGVKNPLRRLI